MQCVRVVQFELCTVTFDTFITSLLNSINFKKKKRDLTDPKSLSSSVYTTDYCSLKGASQINQSNQRQQEKQLTLFTLVIHIPLHPVFISCQLLFYKTLSAKMFICRFPWLLIDQGQGLFIRHILNYTGYNQKWNVNQVRSAQWTVHTFIF